MNNQLAWDTITPFLAPIAPFLVDPEITNIMVNPNGSVFYEKRGQTILAEGVLFPEKTKSIAAQNIARMAGQNISENKPSLTTRLPDGSRIAVVSDRISVGGHTLTIRRFPPKPYSLAELESFGAFPKEVGQLLRASIEGALNILVAGSTNSGKTTLLNALCGEIPAGERIITLEDVAELRIDKPNVVNFQALEGTELTRVSISDLLKETLRHNPERIIVGEMRDKEAFDFLQAMNTGHAGVMSTLHADSASDALPRLASLVMKANAGYSMAGAKQAIAQALSIVVFQRRDNKLGRRLITEIVRVDGYDPGSDLFTTTVLYNVPTAKYVPTAIGPMSAGHPFTTTTANLEDAA